MVCNDLAEMGWGCKIEGRQKFGRGQVFAVEKIDISTALREGLSENTNEGNKFLWWGRYREKHHCGRYFLQAEAQGL